MSLLHLRLTAASALAEARFEQLGLACLLLYISLGQKFPRHDILANLRKSESC